MVDSTRWRRSTLTFVAAGAAACFIMGCTSDGKPLTSPSASIPAIPTPPLTTVDPKPLVDPQKITWQSAVRVDDKTLDVYYVGNAAGCRRLANVRVAESATTVTITLYEGTDPARAQEACPGAGVQARTRVALDAPLAGRKLIDGGATPPAERPLR